MIIESLYIQNFGKLQEFSIDFTEGTNVIKENNGWGKSTLAAFIRAMFYGLEGDGKHSILDNERKRFKPWQGGAFGGNLIFETKGKRYKIERFFGSKSAEDTFVLKNADTGLDSTDFGPNIGEKLFHINSESFRKTVFISQNDCSNSGTSGDINSRIGNIEDSIDLNKFESVAKNLKDAMNHLSTGKTGKQGKILSEISEVKGRVNANSGVEATLNEIRGRIDIREKELGDIKEQEVSLNNQRKAASEEAKRQALRNQYDNLVDDMLAKEKDYQACRDKFPGTVVDAERLSEWDKVLRDMKSAEAVMESNILSVSEQASFDSYSAMFRDGSMSEEEYKSLMADANRLTELINNSRQHELSKEDKDQLSFYKDMFGDESGTVEILKNLSSRWSEKTGIDRDIASENISIEGLLGKIKAGKGKSRIKLVSGVLGSIAILVLGVFMFVKNITPVCFGVAGLGILGVLIFLVLSAIDRKKIRTLESELECANNRLQGLSDSSAQIEKEVYGYFDAHNLVCESGVSDFLLTLIVDANSYNKLKEKEKEAVLNNSTDETEALRSRLSSYLTKFGKTAEGDNYAVSINELWNNCLRYDVLCKKNRENAMARAQLSSSRELLIEQLKIFGFDARIDISGQIEEIRKNYSDYSGFESLYKDSRMKKESFEAENDMDYVLKEASGTELSLDEINSRSLELSSMKADVEEIIKLEKKNRDTQSERLEELDEDLGLLDNLSEELESTKAKYKKIELVKEYLEKAKENLTAKYIGPLQNGFDKYYEILAGGTEKYVLDANMNLSKIEQGAERDRVTLSFGYQDLCGFCMRLSMADAMYKGEKPTLILDDPFVNLDDDKMSGASKLLKEIEKKYQVIYLTCRENRI